MAAIVIHRPRTADECLVTITTSLQSPHTEQSADVLTAVNDNVVQSSTPIVSHDKWQSSRQSLNQHAHPLLCRRNPTGKDVTECNAIFSKSEGHSHAKHCKACQKVGTRPTVQVIIVQDEILSNDNVQLNSTNMFYTLFIWEQIHILPVFSPQNQQPPCGPPSVPVGSISTPVSLACYTAIVWKRSHQLYLSSEMR